jgi:hypothetical protein
MRHSGAVEQFCFAIEQRRPGSGRRIGSALDGAGGPAVLGAAIADGDGPGL